mgnify:FL=1
MVRTSSFLVQNGTFWEDILRANIALISLFHIDFCLFVIKFFVPKVNPCSKSLSLGMENTRLEVL